MFVTGESKIMKKIAICIFSIMVVGCNSGATSPTAVTSKLQSANTMPIPRTWYAYFVDTLNHSLTQCTVGESGINPDSCEISTPSGAGMLDSPERVELLQTSSAITSYAYFTNFYGNSITKCLADDAIVDSSSCSAITPTGAGALNSPTGIVFSGNYAYIADTSNNSYTQCLISSNELDDKSCSTITPRGIGALHDPTGVGVFGRHVFFVNSYNSYTQCTINSNGIDPETCVTSTPSGVGALSAPTDIAFNNGYAYFVDSDKNGFTQCSTDSSGILAGSCVTTLLKNLLNMPSGIAFNGNYAYFTDIDGSYTQCSTTQNGINVDSCKKIMPKVSNSMDAFVGLSFFSGEW
jgi:hypothetical protein